MRQPLTRAKAWRAIAQNLLNEGCVLYGLCGEVRKLAHACRISWSTAEKMWAQLDSHLDGDGWAYRPSSHHEERASAALWMALEAKEEDAKPGR